MCGRENFNYGPRLQGSHNLIKNDYEGHLKTLFRQIMFYVMYPDLWKISGNSWKFWNSLGRRWRPLWSLSQPLLTWFKNFREKLIFFWKLNILRFFKITGHNFQRRRPNMTPLGAKNWKWRMFNSSILNKLSACFDNTKLDRVIFALILEKLTQPQKYFTQLSLVTFVKNSRSDNIFLLFSAPPKRF